MTKPGCLGVAARVSKLSLVAAVSLLGVSLTAEAQPPGKIARVGILASSTEATFAPGVKVFREALQKVGWVEGKNLSLDVRYAGQYAQLPGLAAELVGLKVDVLASFGTPATQALKRAT